MSRVEGTKGYKRVAQKFVAATESIDFNELHQPYLTYIPKAPSHMLDIGAGIGRDAAVLASLGHQVVAVEPLYEFRKVALERYDSPRIRWVQDALPRLETLGKSQFDFILASGVWHHINHNEREIAMQRIAQLMQPSAIFAVSLRHGPAGSGTHVFPIDHKQTIYTASIHGLELVVCEKNLPSLMPGKDNVFWDKLAFKLHVA